ncbi:TetR family transcriptional regulator [Luteococcus sp. Sow4_B9]|uniref:TetR family transcriptional regulator n=1 Tax=Luteococcus sp. Sow4_B9 TaxID=3438792 RepID=UPI003F9DAD44
MTRMSLADRRQKLLEAALAVIGRAGVAAATTRAIAAEAGMPLASFHYAFESHQALMVEAMGRLGEAELDYCEQVTLEGMTVQEVVRNGLTCCLEDLISRPQAHLSRVELADYALRTQGQENVPARWRQERLEVLAAKVTAHQQQTGALKGVDPTALAAVMLVQADGVRDAYLATRDRAVAESVIDAWESIHTAS